MKKIILSAAVAAMALSTSAFAADKGIDITTTGQAVVYYETGTNNGDNADSLGSQNASVANVGVQLNLGADLTHGFTFGSQLTYLGSAGLEKTLVGTVKQGAGTLYQTTDELALTQINVAKTVGNTTVKLGRQELPKSLSPLAYTEGWNVYKNTFDAIIAINADIPDTVLVGAYVTGGTGMSLGTSTDLVATSDGLGSTSTAHAVTGAAYMITAQNKSIPMTTITASYYDLDDILAVAAPVEIEATAIWLDAQLASKDLPMGLKVGLQGGLISPDGSGVGLSNAVEDTMAIGAKVSLNPIDALTVCLAYTTVDGDDTKLNVAVKNTGTGIKSPLFTQMVYNQDAISLDADTMMAKVAYNTGDYGTIIAQYATSSAGKSNLMGSENDYAEFDLMYKLNAGGISYFAAYINRTTDDKGLSGIATSDSEDKVRLWARLNF